MANRNRNHLILAAMLLLGAFATGGCGGGGGATATASASVPVAVIEAVEWTPPTTYFDNTPLNPVRDLSHYEIFVGTSPAFNDNDAPIAAISASEAVVDEKGNSLGRKATCQFVLTGLAPFVESGRSYYVSVRAVGNDNLVSGFSSPVQWDLG